MRKGRLTLLLVLIPATIGPAAYILNTYAQEPSPRAAPKKIEAPAKPSDTSEDSHSQAPQQSSTGEVIGIPLLA